VLVSSHVMLVLDENGLCVNAVVSGTGWSPPAGHRVVAPAGDAWIGWRLNDDGTWTAPEAAPES
jgi:nicotinamide mononucleotide (NMN) deamidase PncC